ncbi:ABC transporter permease [Clostridium brassicae]|uniref:FtsX-like permease family protein n=1 Tax=Clostridium brassicae TaxID=2999072 RepID=A0ABT4D7N8_9CLOT|nr:FtsX-like permease family protein [Clostridium brassicae]MCY6958320.1 FtsX-like permease family protein [Clostridium brassicae]
MRSYKDITNKYLKNNKKRSILTICGIILSVALVTSIGLFIKSMQNSFVQSEIREKGSFHLQMSKNDEDAYKKLKNNPKVDKVGLKENLESVKLRDSKEIDIKKFNKDALELLPYKTIEGRFPNKDEEIALEPWALNYIKDKPKVGNVIKLDIGNGVIKDYKITGLIANDAVTQFEGKSLGITYSDKFDIIKSTIYVRISEKADISDTVAELKGSFKNITTNSNLLTYLGEGENRGVNTGLYLVAAIVIIIAVIATIAVIYNSFQISVIERMKQYGLLRAVGATPKQVRKIVLREATIISLIGIPIGLICGIFAVAVVCKLFKMMSGSVFGEMDIVVPYYVLVISAIIGLVSIYISALIPARFAGKISPLTAISSRASITKEKIKKNRGRIAKKFLGINSLMAFKNIKRNKRRFNITVFSISISVTIFIAFYSFVNISQMFTDQDSESYKTHFVIMDTINKKGNNSLTKDMIDDVKKNDLVKNIFVSYGNYASKALILDNQKDKEVSSMMPNLYKKINFEGKDMTSLDMSFDIYEEAKLKGSTAYVKQGKINAEKMNKENGVILVRNNLLKVNGKYYEGPITTLKVGDSLYVNKNIEYQKSIQDENYNKSNNKNETVKNVDKDMVKIKIVAIVDDPPYSENFKLKDLKLITTKEVIKNISGKNVDDMPLKSAEIVLKDQNKEAEFEKWIQPIGDIKGVKVINMVKQLQQMKNSILQMKVLMYGFVAVISLIGGVNIINTITTNLILRKKEIASLSALGMTYKNIRSMILTEGILYALYGCFYGAIVGTGFSYMISVSFGHIKRFKWGVPWEVIGISVVAAVIVGLIAVIKPLNQIKKENTIDLIRADA